MKSGRKHIWTMPHFAILEVELVWLMAIYLLFPPNSTLGYSLVCVISVNKPTQKILARQVHLKCGSAINTKCMINMVNFFYHFSRVALHFLWRRYCRLPTHCTVDIVMPRLVWTRTEATTALREFQIWYCGGDLCLPTGAESCALVKIFCILHGWGRVFAKPDLFPYHLYHVLSLLV
jgi:hypothetical protein